MKIVFVSLLRVIPWGGSEELWVRTAKLAIVQGHTVYSLTQKWEKTPEHIIEINKLGVVSNFFYKPEYSLLQRFAIKTKLMQKMPEIIPSIDADFYVISTGSTFDFIDYNYITNKIVSTGKPYVLISQHNFENGQIVAEVKRENALQIIRGSKRNFFVSERNLECAERQLAHKINNSAIICNPVNITDISVKVFPASHKLLMACVARLDCSVKGQDILLQVLGSEVWKEREFSLKLYGAGNDLRYLGHLIKFYDLENKVTVEGHVRDIDQIWHDNQVLILPSLNEGTPLSLIEAMLSGRAAVVTDVGGNSKYVLDGKTGFLASTASPECLGEALEKLWVSKHHLQSMGEEAFSHALKITDLEPQKLLLNAITRVLE